MITKAEFEKIKNGMTYKEIVDIVGGEGELVSEGGEEGSETHVVIYMFEGDGDALASATFAITAGKLITKTQLGLK
ncbi:hypothetical protein I6N90_05135 [Paenibacillus sp. GSMTC-2017]|nr:hypothetical protein [Paenibacillus sp. GSMTC-2017]